MSYVTFAPDDGQGARERESASVSVSSSSSSLLLLVSATRGTLLMGSEVDGEGCRCFLMRRKIEPYFRVFPS